MFYKGNRKVLNPYKSYATFIKFLSLVFVCKKQNITFGLTVIQG